MTVVDLVMNAYFQPLHKALGIFIPLIVVNCIIMGRAEAYAAKDFHRMYIGGIEQCLLA